MTPRIPAFLIASLLLAACAKESPNTEGNGPGNADGAGGREDPPVITRPGIPPGGPTASQPTENEAPPSETPPPAQ